MATSFGTGGMGRDADKNMKSKSSSRAERSRRWAAEQQGLGEGQGRRWKDERHERSWDRRP